MIFALGAVALVSVAALAFDTGMVMLEKRDQQNAADAAALAGARYLRDNNAKTPQAAAEEIAAANGFQGTDQVKVYVPPISGPHRGFPGYIEVVIGARRPSIFAGIARITGWDIHARSVAANQPGLDLPFSMLALHPSKCGAVSVTGTGVVTAAGSVQVNSSCVPNALDVGGQGTLTVTADGAVCNEVGEIQRHGSNSQLNCTQVENSYAISDPLSGLIAPPVPTYPAAIQQVAGPPKNRPAGCPGSNSPASLSAPKTCTFGGSYDSTSWRLFPGYYPGGLNLGKGTYYLEPGVYYIGGGGFRAANGGVVSVDAGTTTFGGGVLLYNTEAGGDIPDVPGYQFHAQCAAGTAPDPTVQCLGPIGLNGGTSAVNLRPLGDGSIWDGLVVFQDRNLNFSRADPTLTDLQINGGGSTMEIAGTVYVPSGDVVTNGGSGTLILDQIIGYTFGLRGNGGTIDVRYRSGVTAEVSGAGLVE